MTTNNRYKAALAAAAITFAPLVAAATVLRAVPFDEKVEHSAAIVVGRCVKTESQWDRSGKVILTYATFRIEKTIKGTPAPNQEMTIVTPGGKVGNLRQDSIGVPSFEEGDQNLLFVRNSEVGPTVAYLEQGAYDVVTEGGEQIVRPVATEAVHIDEQRGVAVPAEEARPLRSFEGEVRAAEKRVAFQRLQMMAKKEKEQASIWPVIRRNGLLIGLALVGAALATWQFLRSR
jgi:hypothetical protein